MSYQADPRVDTYIAGLLEWQQRISQEVRELLHEADADVEETIKRTVLPYFVLSGNIAALQATKDHVNVFLYDPLVTDPDGIITRGHEAQTGRQIMVFEGQPINRPALLAMFREIIEHNRAGGWRKLQGSYSGGQMSYAVKSTQTRSRVFGIFRISSLPMTVGGSESEPHQALSDW